MDGQTDKYSTSSGHKHFELEHRDQKLQSSRGDDSVTERWTDRWTNRAPPWVMSNTCIEFMGHRSNHFCVRAPK